MVLYSYTVHDGKKCIGRGSSIDFNTAKTQAFECVVNHLFKLFPDISFDVNARYEALKNMKIEFKNTAHNAMLDENWLNDCLSIYLRRALRQVK